MNAARSTHLVLVLVLAVGTSVPVAALELHAVRFPERRATQLRFLPASGAPDASLEAEVLFRDGPARIDLAFESMKPVVLYGGDVTCYVRWAGTLSGRTENLGELLVREPKGRLSFATANKTFAPLITAEPYYLVSREEKVDLIMIATRGRGGLAAPEGVGSVTERVVESTHCPVFLAPVRPRIVGSGVTAGGKSPVKGGSS